MFTRLRIGLAALLLAAACAGLLFWRNHRAFSDARDLVACLPQTGSTLVSIDVEAIRQSGLLETIAGARGAEDADYRAFVLATGFDYRRDLKRAAAAFRSGDAFFVLTGRFDWDKLRAYAAAQGGACRDRLCRVPTSQPARWASFYPLGSNALALAFSANEFAAADIAERKFEAAALPSPAAPVWALVPAAALSDSRLPAGAQSFTSPLSGARQIVFSISPRAGSELEMALDVDCVSDAAASDLLVKLEGATNMLRKMIEREHLKPNPRDLSGMLTAGVFGREQTRVHGRWPVRRELVEALASGAPN